MVGPRRPGEVAPFAVEPVDSAPLRGAGRHRVLGGAVWSSEGTPTTFSEHEHTKHIAKTRLVAGHAGTAAGMLQRDVVPGVHRIEDARTNWYLIEADRRLVVDDAGVPGSWRSLADALGAPLAFRSGRSQLRNRPDPSRA